MASVEKIIADIKALKIQGAREVAKAGACAMAMAARRSKARTFAAFEKDLKSTAEKLVKARATEPALRHVVASILVSVKKEESGDMKKMRQFTNNLCSHWQQEIDAMLASIAHHGADQIKSKDVVLTHCHSHNVMSIFQLAKQQGKNFQVIVTETRPLRQGLVTARELLKMKIPVIYCVDSAFGSMMKSATKVIVGCDAFLPDGSLVNKIGTFPIALVAKRMGKPFYAAGEIFKFTKEIAIEERDPKEVIEPSKLRGAKIVNPAFDVTPAEYIEKIITEKGAVKPGMLKEIVTFRE